ncbi:MAG: sterol desaturase family protein, partial [Bacteroidota bacterium]
HNPTPLAAHAFHPLEAFLEVAIVLPFVLLIPLHPYVLGLFGLWALTWNIVGHLGYELFPAGWLRHPLTRYLNSSTHHNQHHRDGRYNFSLYFNLWDRVFGTNHPEYERAFYASQETSAQD